MRFRWPHISFRTALGLLDFASCQPAAEVLSSEAIKAKPSEADDDTVEVVEKSNEPAKADEPEHVEDAGTAAASWDDHAVSGWGAITIHLAGVRSAKAVVDMDLSTK